MVCKKTEFFDNKIMKVKEVASFLGISTKTVYEKSKDGLLPHQKVGNRYIFLRSELIKFLKGD